MQRILGRVGDTDHWDQQEVVLASTWCKRPEKLDGARVGETLNVRQGFQNFSRHVLLGNMEIGYTVSPKSPSLLCTVQKSRGAQPGEAGADLKSS